MTFGIIAITLNSGVTEFANISENYVLANISESTVFAAMTVSAAESKRLGWSASTATISI